jgi:hypothetical protein
VNAAIDMAMTVFLIMMLSLLGVPNMCQAVSGTCAPRFSHGRFSSSQPHLCNVEAMRAMAAGSVSCG